MKYQKEGQCKGNDQKQTKNQNLEEGATYLGEHEHIDSSQRELREKDHQVDPREEDGHNSKLPLPPKRTETLVMEHPHKDERENVENDLQPVDQTDEVAHLHSHKLNCLQTKTT
jgi:hypothetical protein